MNLQILIFPNEQTETQSIDWQLEESLDGVFHSKMITQVLF